MYKSITEHYDLLAKSGNDPVNDPPPLRDHMDKWDGARFWKLLGADPSLNVLEIGCGTGRIAVRAAPLVGSYCGIDISPKTIEIARTHIQNANTRLICDDFMTHRFTESFDLIFSSLTFLHIKDKAAAVKKVFGLLNNGGRFVLSIDKCQSNEIDFGAYKVRTYPDDPKMISELLKLSGFSVVTRDETEYAYLFSALKSI